MFAYLLSHPKYQRYWWAVVCSDLGYQVRNIVFLFLVYQMTNHSAEAVAIMLVCEYGPNIFAPIIGVFADRWNRKWTFIASNAGRAISVLVVLLLVPLHAAWIAYLGAVLGTVATMFAQGSAVGFQQQIVATEDRGTTSALRQMVYSAMILIGPPIAAALYAWIHLSGTLALCCALYVLACLLLATIDVDVPTAKAAMREQASFLQEMKEGLAFAWRNAIPRQLLVGSMANGLIGGVINVLEIFVITEFLHLPKSMVSVLLAVQGIAMIIAAPMMGRIKLSMERLFACSLFVIGIGQWLMISFAKFPVTLVGVLIEGLGISFFMISMATLQQTKISIDYQGRFSTINNMVVTLFMSITLLVVGWLHTYMDVQLLLILSGAIAFLIGFVLYSMSVTSASNVLTEGQEA